MTVSANGCRAADHFFPSPSSRDCASWTRASAQPQPYGRSPSPSLLLTNSASAASATGRKCAFSADLISLAGTTSAAMRSSRSSSQCISTQECQS